MKSFWRIFKGFLLAICCIVFLLSSAGLMSLGVYKLIMFFEISVRDLILIWAVSCLLLIFEFWRDEGQDRL
ncbi:MAG: hypothetical protein LWW95_08140 [Candidatus Desulfofervidus auxilii]|nr:hypothetical protein [Candidatus Desulfofervidus auxilii]